MAQKMRGKPVQNNTFKVPDQTFAAIRMTLKEGTSEEKFGALVGLARILEDKPESAAQVRSILKDTMDDGDQRVGWGAVFVLGKIGWEALPELVEGLQNSNDAVKSMSAAMISAILKKDNQKPVLSPVLPELYPEAVRTLIGGLDRHDNSVGLLFMSALKEIAGMYPSGLLGILESTEQTDEIKELELIAIKTLRKHGWDPQA